MKISKKWLVGGAAAALVVIVGLAIGLGQGGLFRGTASLNPLALNQLAVNPGALNQAVDYQTPATAQIKTPTTVFNLTSSDGAKTYYVKVDQSISSAFTADNNGNLTSIDPSVIKEKGFDDVYFQLKEKVPLQIAVPQVIQPQVIPNVVQPITQQVQTLSPGSIVIPPITQNALNGLNAVAPLEAPALSQAMNNVTPLAPVVNQQNAVAPVEAPAAVIAAPAVNLTPVAAPAANLTPVAAPALNLTPVAAPAANLTPVAAPALNLAPVAAPAANLTPVAAPALNLAPVAAPAATPSAALSKTAPAIVAPANLNLKLNLKSALLTAYAAPLVQQAPSVAINQLSATPIAVLPANILPIPMNVTIDANDYGKFTGLGSMTQGTYNINFNSLDTNISLAPLNSVSITPSVAAPMGNGCDLSTGFTFNPDSVTYNGSNNPVSVAIQAVNGTTVVDINNLCQNDLLTELNKSGVGIKITDSRETTKFASDVFNLQQASTPLFGGFVTVVKTKAGIALKLDFTKTGNIGGTTLTRLNDTSTYDLALFHATNTGKPISTVLPINQQPAAAPCSDLDKLVFSPASITNVGGTDKIDVVIQAQLQGKTVDICPAALKTFIPASSTVGVKLHEVGTPANNSSETFIDIANLYNKITSPQQVFNGFDFVTFTNVDGKTPKLTFDFSQTGKQIDSTGQKLKQSDYDMVLANNDFSKTFSNELLIQNSPVSIQNPGVTVDINPTPITSPVITGSRDVTAVAFNIKNNTLNPVTLDELNIQGQIKADDTGGFENSVDTSANVKMVDAADTYYLDINPANTNPLDAATGKITFTGLNTIIQPNATLPVTMKISNLKAASARPAAYQNDIQFRYYLYGPKFANASPTLTNNTAVPANLVPITISKDCLAADKLAFAPAQLTFDLASLGSLTTEMSAYLNGSKQGLDMNLLCQASLSNIGISATTPGMDVELIAPDNTTMLKQALVPTNVAPNYTGLMDSFLSTASLKDATGKSSIKFTNDFTKGNIDWKADQTYTVNVKAADIINPAAPPDAPGNLKPAGNTLASYTIKVGDAAAAKAAADAAAKAAADAAAQAAANQAAQTAAAQAAANQAAQTAAAQAAARAAAAQAAAEAATAAPAATYNYNYSYYTSPAQPAATAVTQPSSTPCVVGDKTFYLAGGPDSTYCKDLQTLVNNQGQSTVFQSDMTPETPQARYTTALAALRILKEYGATIRTKNLSTDWYSKLVDAEDIANASAQELADFRTAYSSGVLQGRINPQDKTQITLAPLSKISYVELMAMFRQSVVNGLGISVPINNNNLPDFILTEYQKNPDWKWIAEAYSFSVEYGLVSKNEFTADTLFNYATRADMVRFLARFKDTVEASPELISK